MMGHMHMMGHMQQAGLNPLLAQAQAQQMAHHAHAMQGHTHPAQQMAMARAQAHAQQQMQHRGQWGPPSLPPPPLQQQSLAGPGGQAADRGSSSSSVPPADTDSGSSPSASASTDSGRDTPSAPASDRCSDGNSGPGSSPSVSSRGGQSSERSSSQSSSQVSSQRSSSQGSTSAAEGASSNTSSGAGVSPQQQRPAGGPGAKGEWSRCPRAEWDRRHRRCQTPHHPPPPSSAPFRPPPPAAFPGALPAADYPLVFRDSAAPTAVATMEGCFVEANAAFSRATGYSRAALLELTIFNLTRQSELQRTFSSVTAMLQTQEEKPRVRALGLMRGGRQAHTIEISLVRGREGMPVFFAVAVHLGMGSGTV